MRSAQFTPEFISEKLSRLKGTYQAATHKKRILKDIKRKDIAFQKRGGLFLIFNENANQAAQNFSFVHGKDFRQKGRPSLPAMALEYVDYLDLGFSEKHTNALLQVALRAEMDDYNDNRPAYHSTQHYADVFALMANFIKHSNISTEDAYLGLIAAMAHDINHPGQGNPPEDSYKNERASFETILPILIDNNFEADEINKINIMLKTTSPNGPHNILKSIASAKRRKIIIDYADIDTEQRFPELEVLIHDSSYLELCSMLSDADLFASSGAGMEAQLLFSKLLTDEAKAAGHDIDFTTHEARMFFFDHIVGKEGFISPAGRRFGNKNYFKMRKITMNALR
jgi:hypothetical protein